MSRKNKIIAVDQNHSESFIDRDLVPVVGHEGLVSGKQVRVVCNGEKYMATVVVRDGFYFLQKNLQSGEPLLTNYELSRMRAVYPDYSDADTNPRR